MRTPIAFGIAASLLAAAASAPLVAQRASATKTSGEKTWLERTPWGDPDLHGEWTSEGEYGVPFERPPQFGTRQFLTDEEYVKRIEDVRIRDERDLIRVDVLSGRVDGPNAPIPHWREYNTTSRRTSLVIDRALHPHGADAIQYQVTFVDPATWTAPWTAALDLTKRPDAAGVFEYACHEGNYGMSNMLSASRSGERAAGEGR